jgi:hypothetical protein
MNHEFAHVTVLSFSKNPFYRIFSTFLMLAYFKV